MNCNNQNELNEFLLERRRDLLKIQKKLSKDLAKAPEGKLRINRSKTSIGYYLRAPSENPNGRYLPRTEDRLIRALAQKDYDRAALDAVNSEIERIDRFLADAKPPAEDIAGLLPPEKRKLVIPFIDDDEEYARKWQETEYVGNDYPMDISYQTDRGDRVRSKSELIIADRMYGFRVPYRYEAPLYLENGGVVYPDFMALRMSTRQVVIWEHLGMMDVPEYSIKNTQKINTYILNGYLPGKNLIVTMETERTPLDTEVVNTIIEKFLR